MTDRQAAVLAMAGAMAIYGAAFPVTRLGTLDGLRPEDLVVLRYLVAGPLLLPIFVRRGITHCAGLGWGRGVVLFVTSGVPMALLLNLGLSLAPAAHGAAIAPGTVTVVGIAFGIATARSLPPPMMLLGLATTLAGLAAIALAGSTSGGPNVALGDLCFLANGFLWGFYPIALQRWRVDPITGTSVVAVLSLPYALFHLAFGSTRLFAVPPATALFQAAFQGLFVVIFGLWLWGIGVRILGADRTQLYPPLLPVIGAALAVPILQEWPGPVQALGIALIVTGIVLTAFGSRQARRERPFSR